MKTHEFKIIVKKNAQEYRYMSFHHGAHAWAEKKIYIHTELCGRIEQSDNPDRWTMPNVNPGTKLIKTRKGTLILVADKGFNTYCFSYDSGYRGSVEITDASGGIDFDEAMEVFSYHSPQGNLGKTIYFMASIATDRIATIKVRRDGKRNKAEDVRAFVFISDKVYMMSNDDDIELDKQIK